MGISASTELTSDELNEYFQLLYLKKSEILHLFERCKELGPEIRTQRNFRYDATNVGLVFPEIRYNPFLDRILAVFSSKADGKLSFEDILDYFSATSSRCPPEVRALWAFKLYDFDGDGEIGRNDIIDLITRLVDGGKSVDSLESAEKELIADAILDDLDLDKTNGVIAKEFVHAVTKISDFAMTFRVKP